MKAHRPAQGYARIVGVNPLSRPSTLHGLWNGERYLGRKPLKGVEVGVRSWTASLPTPSRDVQGRGELYELQLIRMKRAFKRATRKALDLDTMAHKSANARAHERFPRKRRRVLHSASRNQHFAGHHGATRSPKLRED